jgi:hypothetical protein
MPNRLLSGILGTVILFLSGYKRTLIYNVLFPTAQTFGRLQRRDSGARIVCAFALFALKFPFVSNPRCQLFAEKQRIKSEPLAFCRGQRLFCF